MSTKMKTWSKRAQKAHRKAWVAALRSGEYRQTGRILTDGAAFCCLGVACEISKLGYWRDGKYGEWVYQVGSDHSHVTLPHRVMQWLGLSRQDGVFDGSWEDCLTTLNDSGSTFKAIAKIIESEPEGLIVK